MSQLHCTRARKAGQHLTLEDRKMLEYLYNANLKRPKGKRKNQRELAQDLGWSQATLSRELRRGRVKQLRSNLEEYEAYSALVAQNVVSQRQANKGPKLKIGTDHVLATKIEKMLTGEEVKGLKRLRFSPEAVVMHFNEHGWPSETKLSARTIYNYVYSELFLNVSRKDLPRKGTKPKRRYRRIEKRLRPPDCKRIEERPESAKKRQEAGHWEMDCIESIKSDKTCLLTLVDRYTRECLIFKLGRQTQKAVLRRINGLERKMGTLAFKEKFKTITVDNGAEFLDWKSLEKSVYNDGKRTAVYYAHAYSSWERGSSENLNGFIRYFIPKKTELRYIREREIKKLEDFINSYPRKLLNGRSSTVIKKQVAA